MRQRIEKKLRQNLNIDFLEVIDNSHLHLGHIDGQESETHFKIIIQSEQISKLSRIDSHRVINDVLSEELRSSVHALEIKIIR